MHKNKLTLVNWTFGERLNSVSYNVTSKSLVRVLQFLLIIVHTESNLTISEFSTSLRRTQNSVNRAHVSKLTRSTSRCSYVHCTILVQVVHAISTQPPLPLLMPELSLTDPAPKVPTTRRCCKMHVAPNIEPMPPHSHRLYKAVVTISKPPDCR
jgi:hypothetical protein